MTGQLIESLYQITAAHPEERDRLYTSSLTAPDRMATNGER
jgi:hypothetical protein